VTPFLAAVQLGLCCMALQSTRTLQRYAFVVCWQVCLRAVAHSVTHEDVRLQGL
jgi:hypothetical protein